MATNRAVWQDKPGIPGTIREGQIPPKIGENEVLLKAHAWAINPADAIVQDVPLPFISYPLILGEDVAGTVEIVGTGAASKFKEGDRVLAMALGAAVKKPEMGGFQDYVVCDTSLVCKVPETMSFNEAVVFPLGLATVAHALFSKEYLGLPFPKIDPVSSGKSILIWGGSSAVGSNAIQLSKFAGLKVVATCSSRNFDFVKCLGADMVFDYNDPSIVDDITDELDKGPCVGIFQAAGAVDATAQISHKSKQKLFIASATPVPESVVPDGVEARMLMATDMTATYQEVSLAAFSEFLPEALAKGVYKVAPLPELVPTKGLAGIQEALDIIKKGVSAKKIVVEATESLT